MKPYPPVIHHTIHKVYQLIHKELTDSTTLKNLSSLPIASTHEELGSVKMVVNKFASPYHAQGRLNGFYINDALVGLMFYLLPKAGLDIPIIGIDIMSSPYAISLFCTDIIPPLYSPTTICTAIRTLQSLSENLIPISAKRKTPATYQNIFSDNHIIVGIKRNKETEALSLLSNYIQWLGQYIAESCAKPASRDIKPHRAQINNWLYSMHNNIKENNYWEKVFGQQQSEHLVHHEVFPLYS